ncbi:FAD-binding protein [Paractinoplanes aksuensis]|uniref:FAD-binding protein n=1 Tax=Paractinoplanes aksuensis TaxID=2939490 RepID=UPI0034DAD526
MWPARRAGLPLRVTTTGRTVALTGSLLLRPVIDLPVRFGPAARTARVPAGKTWGDVLPLVTPHGLTARHGSSSDVGVIGYLSSGGVSFHGRRYGLAANSVWSLTVVLADGEVVEASVGDRPDLFRAGGGGFGVVVEAQIGLVPMHRVVTGLAALARTGFTAPVFVSITRGCDGRSATTPASGRAGPPRGRSDRLLRRRHRRHPRSGVRPFLCSFHRPNATAKAPRLRS